MAFYVFSNDGNRYGPCDLETLVRWAQEGRVLPDQMIEDDATGARMPARQIPGLPFAATSGSYVPPQANYQSPPPAGYPRVNAYVGDDGAGDVKQAWIFGVLSLLCCPIVFGILGIVAANRAIAKGNPGGVSARTFCIVMTVISVVLGGFSIALRH